MPDLAQVLLATIIAYADLALFCSGALVGMVERHTEKTCFIARQTCISRWRLKK